MIKIRCYYKNSSKYGDYTVLESHFPDGQPHIKLPDNLYLYEAESVTVYAKIADANDLFKVLLVQEVLSTQVAKPPVKLVITYLMGARMDRRIDLRQPFSLKVVADLLKGKFDRIHVLDPHSDVSCALLDAVPVQADNGRARAFSDFRNRTCGNLLAPPTLCSPDAGALKKVEKIADSWKLPQPIVCLKTRDMQTGSLSNFRVCGEVPENVFIVDDILDGGRTFTGVAEALRKEGAKNIGLWVTHGIFSNGFKIPGIDRIYTTNSYLDEARLASFGVDNIMVYDVMNENYGT